MKAFESVVIALLLCGAAFNANAYNYFSCDLGGNLNFNGGNISFNYADNLTAAEKTAISRGLLRTTAVSDTSITTVDNGDSDYEGENGQNEIYRDNIDTADCRNWIFVNTCDVAEVDMRFGNLTWVTTDTSQHLPYASGRNMTGTAIHEAGHCLGMAHSNNLYNMMGDDWDHVTRNGTATYYGPGEDMSDGLIDLYGKKSTNDANRDVGITVFRYDGIDGQYSRHRAGELMETGNVLPVVGSYEGQDVYQVISGHTVQMELTLENNGEKNSEFPSVGLYLSTNSYISSSDTLLRATGISLGRNSPLETTLLATIPAGTAPGNYFLGAFIDHDSQIPEITSGNNVAYYPISVVPPSSDLNVPFISVSKTNLLIEEPFTAYAIARNDGEVASTAGTLRFYRSYDSNISSSDTVMGSVALPALSVGQIFSTNKALVAPIIQRTHYIGACVVGVANETNYTDNCSTGVAVEVTALPPVATTGAATEITTIQATLNGTVDFNGIGSTVYFDWGTTQAYGNTINLGYFADGNGPVNINTTLTDLLCNTAYHYRIRVFKTSGDISGSNVTFTTSVCPGCGG